MLKRTVGMAVAGPVKRIRPRSFVVAWCLMGGLGDGVDGGGRFLVREDGWLCGLEKKTGLVTKNE